MSEETKVEKVIEDTVSTKAKEEPKKKKKTKKKPKTYVYILAGAFVILIAVAAIMMFRIKLLQTQLDLGKSLFDAGNYEEAIVAYEQGLRIYPTSADAYLGITESLIEQGKLSDAIQTLDKGIQVTQSASLEQSRGIIMDQVFATYVLDTYLVNILPGETAPLSVIRRSEDMGFDVTWSSKDESIATVDDNGLITAKALGTTQITATIGNDIWGYRDSDATLIVGIMTTYLEEQGCEYVTSASSLTAPSFIYQETEEGLRKYDGTLETEQQDAIYSLKSCEISDPDLDGNVTYSVEYTVTVPTKFGIVTDSVEAKKTWYYNWKIYELMLCDDYTGQIFTQQSLFGEEGLRYDSDVEWNNMTFHISGNIEAEWVNDEDWEVSYSPLTATTWAEAFAIGTFHLNITVPKEYQGLVLALDKNGITDFADAEYDEEYDPDALIEDTFFFDPMEDGSVRKAEDYQIIKLINFAD